VDVPLSNPTSGQPKFTKGEFLTMPKNSDPITTITMKQRAPKKNSVLFESTDPDSLFQNVYLMRRGASEKLGIKDLDVVKEIEITVKAKE
jgi:hypothetical protein